MHTICSWAFWPSLHPWVSHIHGIRSENCTVVLRNKRKRQPEDISVAISWGLIPVEMADSNSSAIISLLWTSKIKVAGIQPLHLSHFEMAEAPTSCMQTAQWGDAAVCCDRCALPPLAGSHYERNAGGSRWNCHQAFLFRRCIGQFLLVCWLRGDHFIGLQNNRNIRSNCLSRKEAQENREFRTWSWCIWLSQLSNWTDTNYCRG